jgi:hypothetical protein
MGSDRARRSYDPRRMYRSVVSQQGRVTLEADANEAEEIRADESRAELLDIIGPVGAPDDGFKIAVPGAGLSGFDFTIGKGTLYLGGVRVHQDSDNATYFWQEKTEWVGGAPPPPANKIPFTEAVSVAVSEQEVCAVEDEALREVALGGPDSAARTRLIQRVQRLPVSDSDCEKAFAAVLKVYAAGASFDPATMRLDSTMRLRVELVPESATADACHPTAQSGFLGPDNQLIRVQVSDAETMLWGWDNASFLYRVLLSPDKKTLELQGIPVDVDHHPTVNQWVELLGTTVNLGGEARMAGPVGTALQVEASDPGAQTVTLKTAVPEDVLKTHSLPLFLRVWENRITIARDEKAPVHLVTSKGVSTGVRIYTSGTAPVAGDYWTIGVRPSTPQSILPARLAGFQPPDGPRRWVAPLAVVAWRSDLAADVTDCRPPFVDLVELTRRKTTTKCCELLVSPEAHQSKTLTIQDAINTVVKAGGGAICLEAGLYKLEQTLVMKDAKSVRITGKGPTSHLQFDGGVALNVFQSEFVTLDRFRVECTSDKGSTNAIVVGSSNQVYIERLKIDGKSGLAGIGLSGALDDIAIRDNWIRADEGIVDLTDPDIGATGLTNLRVEDNLLECAKVGVLLANVSVHQGVSRFIGNSLRSCDVAGFQLQGMTVPGCAVEVIGNDFGVTGDGIITGLNEVRIADNDLTPPKREGPTRGKRGIVMTKGVAPSPVDDAQIVGNRITSFEVGIRAEVPLGSVSIGRNQISTLGTGVDIRSTSNASLTIDHNRIASIEGKAIVIVGEKDRIMVADNHLEVKGGNLVVSVTCKAGDCLFCQNYCAAPNTDPKAPIPTVNLDCRTLVLASNRVEGRVALTCAISKVTKVPLPLCTVLGNVSGMITVNSKPLTIPWEPLNVSNA